MRWRFHRTTRQLFAVLAGWSMAGPSPAENAQELVEDSFGRGHGSILLSVQALNSDIFRVNGRSFNVGDVDTHNVYLEVQYAVADRWLLTVGIPWVERRYVGPNQETTDQLAPPNDDAPFLDDGQFHDGMQDWVLGINYLLDTQPLHIEPFVHVYVPSHEYPHYGRAAIGQNLWRVELGVEATHILPFSDWYYRLNGSYVIVEQTLGYNVNHYRLGAELGYFLTPTLTVNAFTNYRNGRGYTGPYPNRTDELWYQHGRLAHHANGNYGFGADWLFHDRWSVNLTGFRSYWAKSANYIDWAANLGLTRYF